MLAPCGIPVHDAQATKNDHRKRRRLQAGIAEARRRLPRVYAGSVDLPLELTKFPLEEELEMQEQAETKTSLVTCV